MLLLVFGFEAFLVGAGIMPLTELLEAFIFPAAGAGLFAYFFRKDWYLTAGCIFVGASILQVLIFPKSGYYNVILAIVSLPVLVERRSLRRYEIELKRRIDRRPTAPA